MSSTAAEVRILFACMHFIIYIIRSYPKLGFEKAHVEVKEGSYRDKYSKSRLCRMLEMYESFPFSTTWWGCLGSRGGLSFDLQKDQNHWYKAIFSQTPFHIVFKNIYEHSLFTGKPLMKHHFQHPDKLVLDNSLYNADSTILVFWIFICGCASSSSVILVFLILFITLWSMIWQREWILNLLPNFTSKEKIPCSHWQDEHTS